MELILIRHGLPERSGQTADPPLSAKGLAQARQVGAHLQPEAIDAVWASTMQRAVETAEPLAAAKGLTVKTHRGVCEYDKDQTEYVPDEVLRIENPEAWKAMVAGHLDFDIDAFQRDVVDGLEEIIQQHPAERVAVFCHGGVINVWTAHVLGMPAKLFFYPDYTSVSRFRCARGGARNIVTLNERAHLTDLTEFSPLAG